MRGEKWKIPLYPPFVKGENKKGGFEKRSFRGFMKDNEKKKNKLKGFKIFEQEEIKELKNMSLKKSIRLTEELMKNVMRFYGRNN